MTLIDGEHCPCLGEFRGELYGLLVRTYLLIAGQIDQPNVK